MFSTGGIGINVHSSEIFRTTPRIKNCTWRRASGAVGSVGVNAIVEWDKVVDPGIAARDRLVHVVCNSSIVLGFTFPIAQETQHGACFEWSKYNML